MIRYADKTDCEFLSEYDKHISEEELNCSVERSRILLYCDNKTPVALLRYNLFWDNTPFCNMLFVTVPYRKKGIGSALVTAWEREMHGKGYRIVMTSTQENEEGQFFWRKAGYDDCGAFQLGDEPKELILCKNLNNN